MIDFDTEYNLNNTGFENPNTTLKFYIVPWDNQYNDVILFRNNKIQNIQMNSLLKETIENFNYIAKDKAFLIHGNVAEFEGYNYLSYVNSNYNNKTFYCFIEKIEYIAKNVTKIYVTTDVWQTWQFDLKYYDCFIERAHIKKSDDIVGRYIAPEPVNFECDFEKEITVFNDIDWSIHWIAECLSSVANNSTDYKYGGNGTGLGYTGTYGFSIGGAGQSGADILLRRYYKGDEVTDHRSDIISVNAVPDWIVSPPVLDDNGYLANNDLKTITDIVNITADKLPCGYVPKNNKLFSSLYRVLIVFNRNGLTIPLKPELLDGNQIQISLSARPIANDNIRVDIKNYNQYSKRFYSIPLNVSTGIAYNENTGLQQKMTVLSGALKTVTSVGALAGSIYSGNVAGAIQSAGGIIETGVSLKGAFEQKTASIGSASDVNALEQDNIKLSVVDCSPQYYECKQIDDFLSVYGYQLNEIGNIGDFIQNRSKWNYIKTNNAKIKMTGNQDDLNIIINMFNKGVTLWRSVVAFGNYALNND